MERNAQNNVLIDMDPGYQGNAEDVGASCCDVTTPASPRWHTFLTAAALSPYRLGV